MNKVMDKVKLHPIMAFMVLILATMVLSGILAFFGVEATYNVVNPATKSYDQTLVTVESLLNLSGLKYIFSSTISNFAAFTPLIMLIIVLIGIGVMEKSDFLKTAITMLTKKTSKRTITFVISLICILFSIAGDIGYVVMIPISALIFFYGRRNPLLGITTAFASLTCGSGLSILVTSLDSSLFNITTSAASILDSNFSIHTFGFILIMLVSIVLLAMLITAITERFLVYKIDKYEFKEEKKEFKLGKKEIRG